MLVRPTLLSLAAVAIALVALPAASPPGPVFHHPLSIDNEFMPFVVGATKIYAGQTDGVPTDVIDDYLFSTRTFSLNGKPVKCRQLDEIVFEDDELHEVAHNWFAQADDGAVYYFGETVDNYEDGRIADHNGSWLVGGATKPGDPAETAKATAPGLFMPAEPEVGDHWKPEDLLPFVDETVTLLKEDVEVEVPAGEFDDAILVKETSKLPEATPEKKWYAPHLGVVRVKAVNEFLLLVEVHGFPLDDDCDD